MVILEHQVVLSYHRGTFRNVIIISTAEQTYYCDLTEYILTWLTQRELKRSSRDSKFIFPCKFYLQYSTGWLTETLITSFLNNPLFQPSQYPVSTFIFTFQQLNKPLTFTILSSQNNSQQGNIL